MRIALPLLLLLLLGVPALAEEAPPRPEAIDRAIDEGVAWVLEAKRANGTWGKIGPTALALFALVDSGFDPTSKPLSTSRRALGRVLRTRKVEAVYDASLLILLGRDAPNLVPPGAQRWLVEYLSSIQAANGQWSYGRKRGGRHDAGDNSNTQFAVLALGAATGNGIGVDPAVLDLALRWWRTSKQGDGGFGYASGGSMASQSTGSMTAAGVASLGILEAATGHRLDDEARRDVRNAKTAAIKRLAEEFRVDHNFGPSHGKAGQRQRKAGRGWVHYYLWSVERAMVLAGHELLGTHDWYAEGVRHLLETQKKDGSWRGEHPLYATCFALLFLARAADPPRVFTPSERPTVTEGDEVRPDGSPPPPDPSATDGRDPAVVELHRAYLGKPPIALLDLVKALDQPLPEVRRRANELLRLLLGDERVGRADRHPLVRGRLALWIRKNARFLERDGDRFVLRED